MHVSEVSKPIISCNISIFYFHMDVIFNYLCPFFEYNSLLFSVFGITISRELSTQGTGICAHSFRKSRCAFCG